MTRGEKHIVLVGGEDEKEIKEITEPKDKIENLNTYQKMIRYSVEIENANTDTIEFLKEEEMEDMNICKLENKEEQDFDKKEIINRLKFEKIIKPRNYSSVSKYMNYKKCPRRFYIENILKVEIEEDDINEVQNDKINELDFNINIDPAQKGQIAHKLLEIIDGEEKNSYEYHIENLCSNLDLEIQELDFLKKELKRYVQNYFEIEENNNEYYGKLVKSYNELSYMFSPIDDIKTMIVGFIDRLKIYNKDGKYSAVIIDYKTNKVNSEKDLDYLKQVYKPQLLAYGKAVKDLLMLDGYNIDDIILKLYFLDKGKEVSVNYDEDEASNLMKNIDEISPKIAVSYNLEDYPKAEKEYICPKCDYFKECR